MLFSILIVVFTVILFAIDYMYKYQVFEEFSKFPGPLCLPIFGGIWYYYNKNPENVLELTQELLQQYGKTVKLWVVYEPGIITCDQNYIQGILTHPTEINKNRLYKLIEQWLGGGLLLSDGVKWLKRRRIITPTFHFKILEEFITIFDQQANILVNQIEKYAKNDEAVNIHDYIALATLDVICETSMGVKINAQIDSNCEYVRLLNEITTLTLVRFIHVSYRLDFLFRLLAPTYAKRMKQVTQKLHQFTENIIKERRKEMLEKPLENTTKSIKNKYDLKNRKALLDVLLTSTIDGKPLSNTDIREEVDTFMFEGHDTTKSGLGFTLYCISRHPHVQNKLYEEIKESLGADSSKELLTYRQLMDLKYLDLVIKEALRMYPPVPFIGRKLLNDCVINGTLFKKHTSIIIALMSMQNDPEYVSEPDRFLPEREYNNSFVSVPFSAGPRNCIGQRFAMLEIKAFIVRIIQNYELLPLGKKVEPNVHLILESKTGWQMGFRKR